MFTKEQINEIAHKLGLAGIKDTEFPPANPISENDQVAIVQNGKNKLCSVKELRNGTVTPSPQGKFTVNVSSLDFDAKGGSKSFVVTTANNQPPTVTLSDSTNFSYGITGSNGHYQVKITASPNLDEGERECLVTITSNGETIITTVTQTGTPFVFEVPGTAALKYNTEGITLTIKSSQSWSATVDAGASSWLTIEGASTGSGNPSYLTIKSLTKNIAPDKRSGIIAITSNGITKEIVVTQANRVDSGFSVEPIIPTVGKKAGDTCTIKVTSALAFTVEVADAFLDKFQITPTAGDGDTELTLTALKDNGVPAVLLGTCTFTLEDGTTKTIRIAQDRSDSEGPILNPSVKLTPHTDYTFRGDVSGDSLSLVATRIGKATINYPNSWLRCRKVVYQSGLPRYEEVISGEELTEVNTSLTFTTLQKGSKTDKIQGTISLVSGIDSSIVDSITVYQEKDTSIEPIPSENIDIYIDGIKFTGTDIELAYNESKLIRADNSTQAVQMQMCKVINGQEINISSDNYLEWPKVTSGYSVLNKNAYAANNTEPSRRYVMVFKVGDTIKKLYITALLEQVPIISLGIYDPKIIYSSYPSERTRNVEMTINKNGLTSEQLGQFMGTVEIKVGSGSYIPYTGNNYGGFTEIGIRENQYVSVTNTNDAQPDNVQVRITLYYTNFYTDNYSSLVKVLEFTLQSMENAALYKDAFFSCDHDSIIFYPNGVVYDPSGKTFRTTEPVLCVGASTALDDTALDIAIDYDDASAIGWIHTTVNTVTPGVSFGVYVDVGTTKVTGTIYIKAQGGKTTGSVKPIKITRLASLDNITLTNGDTLSVSADKGSDSSLTYTLANNYTTNDILFRINTSDNWLSAELGTSNTIKISFDANPSTTVGGRTGYVYVIVGQDCKVIEVTQAAALTAGAEIKLYNSWQYSAVTSSTPGQAKEIRASMISEVSKSQYGGKYIIYLGESNGQIKTSKKIYFDVINGDADDVVVISGPTSTTKTSVAINPVTTTTFDRRQIVTVPAGIHSFNIEEASEYAYANSYENIQGSFVLGIAGDTNSQITVDFIVTCPPYEAEMPYIGYMRNSKSDTAYTFENGNPISLNTPFWYFSQILSSNVKTKIWDKQNTNNFFDNTAISMVCGAERMIVAKLYRGTGTDAESVTNYELIDFDTVGKPRLDLLQFKDNYWYLFEGSSSHDEYLQVLGKKALVSYIPNNIKHMNILISVPYSKEDGVHYKVVVSQYIYPYADDGTHTGTIPASEYQTLVAIQAGTATSLGDATIYSTNSVPVYNNLIFFANPQNVELPQSMGSRYIEIWATLDDESLDGSNFIGWEASTSATWLHLATESDTELYQRNTPEDVKITLRYDANNTNSQRVGVIVVTFKYYDENGVQQSLVKNITVTQQTS